MLLDKGNLKGGKILLFIPQLEQFVQVVKKDEHSVLHDCYTPCEENNLSLYIKSPHLKIILINHATSLIH